MPKFVVRSLYPVGIMIAGSRECNAVQNSRLAWKRGISSFPAARTVHCQVGTPPGGNRGHRGAHTFQVVERHVI
jgi:hypothetical protein